MRRMIATALILAVCLATPAAAGDPPGFKDFTFKRIGVPKPGSAKRITVQIAPVPETVAAAPKSPVPALPDTKAAPASAAFAWYWDAVSPDLAGAAGGRFAAAVRALDKAPAGQGVHVPRLQLLQGIAQTHGTEILKATVGTRVSPALVLAVIAVESGGNAAAQSKAGALGLMQLMPDTASRFGVDDSVDAGQNIRGGVAYLDWLLREFDQDAVLALAGYNAGEGAVKRNGGVPPYAETRGYVPKVLAAWTVARGLCLTPPDLPGDGCVFAVRTAAND